MIQKRLENNKYSEIELIIGEIKSKVLNTSVSLKDQTKDNISYTMIEYYTLIAMTALYGGTIAIYITNLKLANMGSIGKRTAVTAIKKSSLLLSSLLASYLIQILELALLFLFTIFVLSVDYGNNLLYIIILALIGSFAGLTLGVAIATLIRASENTKTGILIAVTMFGCFLSGMMGITMKYVVDTYAPLVNLVNPAALITDGFYNLYYYGLNDNFILDLILLLVFSAVMLLISYRGLRRQKYDSI